MTHVLFLTSHVPGDICLQTENLLLFLQKSVCQNTLGIKNLALNKINDANGIAIFISFIFYNFYVS